MLHLSRSAPFPCYINVGSESYATGAACCFNPADPILIPSGGTAEAERRKRGEQRAEMGWSTNYTNYTNEGQEGCDPGLDPGSSLLSPTLSMIADWVLLDILKTGSRLAIPLRGTLASGMTAPRLAGVAAGNQYPLCTGARRSAVFVGGSATACTGVAQPAPQSSRIGIRLPNDPGFPMNQASQ